MARGEWYANQDFNTRNLMVHKGEKLPEAWQAPGNPQYLKKAYGEDCIVMMTKAERSAQIVGSHDDGSILDEIKRGPGRPKSRTV